MLKANVESLSALCSVRRGYQVYREVCAACHSLEYLCFRHLTNVSHTDDEVKAIAAEVLYCVVIGMV